MVGTTTRASRLGARATPTKKQAQQHQQPKRRGKQSKRPAAAAVKLEEPFEVKSEVKLEHADDGGPFPYFSRPTQQECRNVTDIMRAIHGDPEADWKQAREQTPLIHGGLDVIAATQEEHQIQSVLDSLVRTILSQNTTDVTSHKAFASLKARFPTWDSVRTGDPAGVADSIRCGGLSEIKTGRIQTILNAIHAERGECSLEHLREEPDDAIKAYLSGFKGVGPKTISCVLMFCLARPEFPVDVHVWKMAISLGWVPAKASREQTYEHLNRRVPDDVKYALHVLLVEHGKVYNNDVKLLKPGTKKEG